MDAIIAHKSMLEKGFLGRLADWTAEAVFKDRASRDKATASFGVAQYDSIDTAEEIMPLFSEWIIFDYRHDVFKGKTGLEYFVEKNPLRLPPATMRGYEDMLDFEVGLFDVRAVEQGKGVSFISLRTGKTHFVHDVGASMSLHTGSTVWTRIASICGMYHCVGSSCFPIPIKIIEGLREAMRTWDVNSFDAGMMASFVGKPSIPALRETKPISLTEAEATFRRVLRKYGMDDFFTMRACREWLINEEKYPMGFAMKAVFGLIPDDAPDAALHDLIKAFTDFSNSLPRPLLGGRTPFEAQSMNERDAVESEIETDLFSHAKHLRALENAHAILARGTFAAAYKAFESVVRDLAASKLPFFPSFKIYANAGVCSCNAGNEALGSELLDAALRINPLYDFAKRCHKIYPFTGTAAMRVHGERQYRRSAFWRYEQFLKNVDISLRYKTKTVPVVYKK